MNTTDEVVGVIGIVLDLNHAQKMFEKISSSARGIIRLT